MRRLDPHVHLRDWNESAKETLAHGFDLAARCGVGALFEMPNTSPTITTPERVVRRIADGDASLAPLPTALRPFHGVYVGLTDDPDQIAGAVEAWNRYRPRVVGFKLYAGHSTGRMGVITSDAQLRVWRTLARLRYRGVLAIHCEREDLLRPDVWRADDPATHGPSRPPLAEIASVQTHIAFAEAARFRGTLHIVHVTCPETAELIARERAGLPFRLTAAVTPHHALLTESVALRVNPPLRDERRRATLAGHLLAGTFDWIESDHAPHTPEAIAAGASGFPAIAAFRHLCDELDRLLPPDAATALTGGAVLRTFDLDPALVPDAATIAESRGGASPASTWWGSVAAEYPIDPYGGAPPALTATPRDSAE